MNDLNKTILVTGGAGFIGSNFISYYLEQNPEQHIINLDALTYAGDLENLSEVESNPRYTFIKGDIRNRDLLEKIFQDHNIQGVIHFAADFVPGNRI